MDYEPCYTAALRLLNFRFRAEKELETRLLDKGHSPDAVTVVLQRLREEGWLDDRRFATGFAVSQRLRHRGRRRIARELQARGVGREDVAAALEGGATDEREQMSLACQKRIRALVRLKGPDFVDSPEARRKLTNYLLRQGYDYGAVLEVVDAELKVNRE